MFSQEKRGGTRVIDRVQERLEPQPWLFNRPLVAALRWGSKRLGSAYRWVGAVLFALVAIGGTAVVPAANATPAQRVTAAPLPGTTVDVWSQYDQYPRRMMRVDDGFCYLTAVHGNFRGGGEVVRIWNQDGYWMLGGQSGQQDVTGVATCVSYSSIQGSIGRSMDSSWTWIEANTCPWLLACGINNTNSVELGKRGDFCYLTGMGGRFDGGGEDIDIRSTYDGIPILHVKTLVERGYIYGAAACIRPNAAPSGYSRYITSPATWNQGEKFVRLMKGTEGFCTFTEIHGGFYGNGEEVAIFYNSEDGFWYLGGRSQQDGVGATARCFVYQLVHGVPIE